MQRKIFLIFLFLLILIPSNVYAANDVSISCDKTVLRVNEETTCKLNINNLKFTAIDVSGTLKIGNNLSIVDSSYDKNTWLSLDNSFDIYNINLIRHTNTMVNNLTIATFRVKASGNATGNSSINFNNILVGNSDYQSVSLNCSQLNIHFGSNINTLKSLSVSDHNINFSSDITSYSLNTDSDSINISASATDSNAIINGMGNKKVSYGNNSFDIIVVAENGLEKKYTINVHKKDNRSSVNDLSKITLSNGKIDFDKNISDYVVNVENDIDNIEISYELEDDKSIVEIIGDSNLSVGENNFVIKVTAENGSVKEYKITVIRADNIMQNDDKVGFNITIKNHEISFNKNKYEYWIKTPENKLDIKVATDENILNYVVLGNEKLENNSIIWIIINYIDGSSNYYKINIEKENAVLGKNSNIFLFVMLFISIIANVLMIIFLIKKKLFFCK